jgi:hypothetical protein
MVWLSAEAATGIGTDHTSRVRDGLAVRDGA